jgi:hypothetical protein
MQRSTGLSALPRAGGADQAGRVHHDLTARGHDAAEFRELDRRACLRLLRGGVVGRVVFTHDALPAAQPVNYVLDGEEVLFRTASAGTLAVATRGAVVAFEVDDIDPESRTGWSVLGVGEAYEVVDPRRLAEWEGHRLDTWAPLQARHMVCIPMQVLTGRALTRGAAGQAVRVSRTEART